MALWDVQLWEGIPQPIGSSRHGGLLGSIAARWEKDAGLCRWIPFNRVYTGRVPGTESYAGTWKNLTPMEFPYCSILTSPGWSVARSDKSDLSKQRVTFSLWLNDATLHLGEIIQDNLYRVYANQAWVVEPQSADIACRGLPKMQVIDCLDRGEGGPKQTTIATVKAWEVTRTFVLEIERQRQDLPACPAAWTSGSSGSGSSSKSKSSSEPSSSSKSSSSSNDTPEGPPLFEEE